MSMHIGLVHGIRWLVIAILLVSGSAFGQDGQPSPAPIYVAILEPEVLAGFPRAERHALAGSLESLLTDTLARQSGYVLLDRETLDNILAEKIGQAAGVSRIEPDALTSSLRPFWSAGVLICSQIDTKVDAIIVEAVSAQTGQALAEICAKVNATSIDDIATTIGPKIEPFAREVRLKATQMRGKPLVEISGRPASGLSRLAWMVDDLAEAASATVTAAPGAILLLPRHPLVTKEERLLRAMGLADVRKDAVLAVLSPVPQMRFSFELMDSTKVGVSFGKTPLRLKLVLQHGEGETSIEEIEGQADQWEACRSQATDWLARQLAAHSGSPPNMSPDDHERAKRLAEEELASVESWTGLSFYEQQKLNLPLRRRIAQHVLRAAHLDPTNEPAAYLAACYVDALYPHDGKEVEKMSLATIDRAMVEVQRYLDRFSGRDVEHHLAMIGYAGRLGVSGAWQLAGGSGRRDAILRPPDVRQYPYVRFYVRAWAEHGYLGKVDRRYANSNSFAAFSFNLVNRLVPCIPDDRLDEEYEYWRTFYATKVEKVLRTSEPRDFSNTRPAPWDLVDAAFQARKKNPQGVREAFQRLASQFSSSETVLWGGDQWTPPRVAMYLKAAGDADWATWKPECPHREVRVTSDDRTALYHRFSPNPLGVMDLEQTIPLGGMTQLVFDDDVLESGRELFECEYPRIQPLVLVDGHVWLVAPGVWNTINGKKDHSLFVVGLDQISLKRSSLAVKARRVPWPAREGDAERIIITCYQPAPDGRTLWIGTESHGLVKFVRQEDHWAGHWMGQRQGLPAGRIVEIVLVPSGQSQALQIHGVGPTQSVVENGNRQSQQQAWRCQVDRVRETIQLLGTPQTYHPKGTPPVQLTTTQDGKTRHWEMPIGPFYYGDRWRIRQIAPKAGKPEAMVVEGRLSSFARGGRDFLMYASFNAPLDEPRMAMGLGECIWMVSRWFECTGSISPRHWTAGYGEGEILMIYRPAPDGVNDWSRHDRWIGPFLDRHSIFAVMADADDRVWLTTGSGVYVTDWKTFVARHRDRGFSTQQWREINRKRREQADWRIRVRQYIVEKQLAQAIAIVDQQLAAIGSVDARSPAEVQSQWTIAQLHKAMLLARDAATQTAALDLYRQLATCPWVEPAARERSWACHIETLAEMERWADVVRTAEYAATMFPRLALDSPGTHACGEIVERARQMLRKKDANSSSSATEPANPSSRPVITKGADIRDKQ